MQPTFDWTERAKTLLAVVAAAIFQDERPFPIEIGGSGEIDAVLFKIAAPFQR